MAPDKHGAFSSLTFEQQLQEGLKLKEEGNRKFQSRDFDGASKIYKMVIDEFEKHKGEYSVVLSPKQRLMVDDLLIPLLLNCAYAYMQTGQYFLAIETLTNASAIEQYLIIVYLMTSVEQGVIACNSGVLILAAAAVLRKERLRWHRNDLKLLIRLDRFDDRVKALHKTVTEHWEKLKQEKKESKQGKQGEKAKRNNKEIDNNTAASTQEETLDDLIAKEYKKSENTSDGSPMSTNSEAYSRVSRVVSAAMKIGYEWGDYITDGIFTGLQNFVYFYVGDGAVAKLDNEPEDDSDGPLDEDELEKEQRKRGVDDSDSEEESSSTASTPDSLRQALENLGF